MLDPTGPGIVAPDSNPSTGPSTGPSHCDDSVIAVIGFFSWVLFLAFLSAINWD